MKTPEAGRKRKKPLILTSRDEKILRAIYAYRYMTALDVAWLLFKPTSKTHVREILSALAGGEDLKTHAHLCRFGLPGGERIFTLGARGRSFLAEQGVVMRRYFFPYKASHLSYMHLQHSLLLTRFVVAATIWARQQSAFTLSTIRFGYEFRKASVVPDCWLLFERASNGNEVPIFLEIDRGREYQQRFKAHIRARIQFIEEGSYTKMFGSRSVTIAYATTGEIPAYRERRRQTMVLWTREVLAEQRKEEWASIFRFAEIEYGSLFDLTLFEKPVWFRPDSPTAVPLLPA